MIQDMQYLPCGAVVIEQGFTHSSLLLWNQISTSESYFRKMEEKVVVELGFGISPEEN